MNQIRSSVFWIINCNATFRSFISRWITCRCLRGNLHLREMASLPMDRMCEELPFTYCCVEVLGPFVAKEGSKELKQYRRLFICLSNWATHIKARNSLSTDWSAFSCTRQDLLAKEEILDLSDLIMETTCVRALAERTNKAFTEMNH